jgi:hypothetical protein
MSKFVFFFQPMVAGIFFRENGDLLFLPVSGNKLQIQAWDLLLVVAQHLLIKAGNYIIFEVDNLNVYSLVRLWLSFFCVFLKAFQNRACPHYYKRHDSY